MKYIKIYQETKMSNIKELRGEIQEVKKEIQLLREHLLKKSEPYSTISNADLKIEKEFEEAVCADLFKSLANEERLKILKALNRGDMYFAQLMGISKLDHSPLRFHLTVLKDVNLITQERFRGKYIITELGVQALTMASYFFQKICSQKVKNDE
ncbi:MAG: ArsR/SmtB family transcription factor [Candidatus Methanofastidiosia archaeon]